MTKLIHSKNKKVQNDLPYFIFAYHTYFVLNKQTQTRTNEIFLCFQRTLLTYVGFFLLFSSIWWQNQRHAGPLYLALDYVPLLEALIRLVTYLCKLFWEKIT